MGGVAYPVRSGLLILPGPVRAARARGGARANRITMAATAAILTAGVLLLAGCSAASSPSSETTSALNPGTTMFTPASAPRIPHVTGHLLTGGKLSLTAYWGHVTVLNFWGPWCTIGREEAPALSAAARHFGPAGVRFIGVDVQDNTASANAYMKDFKISYPSLSDPSGRAHPRRRICESSETDPDRDHGSRASAPA